MLVAKVMLRIHWVPVQGKDKTRTACGVECKDIREGTPEEITCGRCKRYYRSGNG